MTFLMVFQLIVIQHLPVIPGENRCLETLQAFLEKCFRGSKTDPHKV